MPLSPIRLDQFEKIARGVSRPEDVVVGPDGRVFASDDQAAVAEILSDGSIRRLGRKGGAPNGINMDTQGRIIIANFGVYHGQPGPLERFDPATGDHETLVAQINGRPLSSCNYPAIAADGTIWCTHTTWADPWPLALDGRADGFVFARLSDGSVRIAAQNLKMANGCCLNADETHLFVCQTTGGNVVRYPILAPGQLGPPEPYGPQLGLIFENRIDPADPVARERLKEAGYTDGCGFDVEGNLWVTLPAANRIVAIRPDLSIETIVQDGDGETLNHPTNVSWGGPDMRDLYIGSITTDYVLKTKSPVAGLKLAHQR